MRLESIQALRALAAVLVAYCHSIDVQMQFSVSRQQRFYYLENFGAIGVDLFFVISGFIITLVARQYVGTKQGLRFLSKRFIRINPIYYVASLLFEAIVLLKTLSLLPANVAFGLFASGLPASLVDTLLIVPSSGRPLAYTPFLIVGWTLAFEWIFYALFFLLIWSRTPHKAEGLCVQIILLVIAGSLFHVTDYRLVFLTNPILLEFLLGVAICWVYLRVQKVPRWVSILCLLIGLAGYAYSVRFGFGNISELLPVLTGRASLRRVLWWGVPSAFLAAGCIFLEMGGQLRSVWRNRWLRQTGDASYSIYLVHLSVFHLCALAYAAWGFFLPADVAIFAQLFLAVAVSLVFYRYVEAPLLRTLHASWRV